MAGCWQKARTRLLHIRFGRPLPRLLRGAGLSDIHAQARISLTGPDTGHLQRTLVLRSRDRLLAASLITAEEIEQHLADIAQQGLGLAAFPVVSAWAARPSLLEPGPHQHWQIAESFGPDVQRDDRTRPSYPGALVVRQSMPGPVPAPAPATAITPFRNAD